MQNSPNGPLLTPDDPPSVTVVNPHGVSQFLLIGDHAGNIVPQALGSLGLPPEELNRHIGWDIGIAGLGLALATRLDAVFIRQTYSRLVIDCNRDPGAVDAMPAMSDGTVIPANAMLDDAARAARIATIHTPYQAVIADELMRRDEAGRATALISLHSFTPSMGGVARPWQIGVLYDQGDLSLVRRTLARLRADDTLTVGDNEPYRMDSIDYTIPRHAYPDRPYLELEIRQDLLETPEGIAEWADRITALLAD